MNTLIGITNGWNLYDADGYVSKRGVEVEHYADGTTRINGTLHATDHFVKVSNTKIDSGSWYLERNAE